MNKKVSAVAIERKRSNNNELRLHVPSVPTFAGKDYEAGGEIDRSCLQEGRKLSK